jgi:hypothetical protein
MRPLLVGVFLSSLAVGADTRLSVPSPKILPVTPLQCEPCRPKVECAWPDHMPIITDLGRVDPMPQIDAGERFQVMPMLRPDPTIPSQQPFFQVPDRVIVPEPCPPKRSPSAPRAAPTSRH